jgi:hypothetical protein
MFKCCHYSQLTGLEGVKSIGLIHLSLWGYINISVCVKCQKCQNGLRHRHHHHMYGQIVLLGLSYMCNSENTKKKKSSSPISIMDLSVKTE